MKFIAWTESPRGDRSSFASGSTLDECESSARSKLLEMIPRMRARGMVRDVVITAGAKQTEVKRFPLN